jgi:multicomponent Na+:H+ antiporter subunit E
LFHAISLWVMLFGTWILLSGHFDPLLLGLGALSAAAVVGIALRMEAVDHEGHPIHLAWKAPVYWAWLAWAIVKSNIDVTRRILTPSLPIDPCVIKVRAHQKDELGRAVYANWITLTPGTVSMDVAGREITVHALSTDGVEELQSGRMDRRASRLVGFEE